MFCKWPFGHFHWFNLFRHRMNKFLAVFSHTGIACLSWDKFFNQLLLTCYCPFLHIQLKTDSYVLYWIYVWPVAQPGYTLELKVQKEFSNFSGNINKTLKIFFCLEGCRIPFGHLTSKVLILLLAMPIYAMCQQNSWCIH